MLHKILVLISSFLLLMHVSRAQEVWTLRMVIDTALQNNLGLRIARNQAEIAAINNNPGSAGMLPDVNVNASATKAQNDIRQEFRTGEVLSNKNVEASNAQAFAGLSWTVFDGFRMFAARDRLRILEEIGDLNVRRQTLDIMGRTAQSFFDVQRQQLLVEFTRNGLSLYEERVRLSERRLELGNAPKTEFLQASVDYNEQLSILTTRIAALENAKVMLNGLLMRNVTDSIRVSDSITVEDAPAYEFFLSRLGQGNPDVKEQLLLHEVAEKQLKESRSAYFPVLDINAGYNYSQSSTTRGFFLENRSMGPVTGLSFNWNLFNGSAVRNDVRNAKILLDNTRLNSLQVRQDLEVALRTAWLNYTAALEIYKRETASNRMAVQNVEITGERFRLGESTVLELREAQRTKEDTQSRLASAYYDVRIALVQLMQLTGEIF